MGAQVAPQFKLPIFYLTDSILKNVRGPYPALFGRVVVPLYCNCVRQVSGKDLRRFIHVLTTWEQSRVFAPAALAQMRAAATKAQALAEPSLMAQPASFAQPPGLSGPSGSGPQAAPRRSVGAAPPPPSVAKQQQQQDMELRSLLTRLQNEMGIHPTEHMTLEEVRVNNPEYYAQLLEFRAAEKQPQQQQQPQALQQFRQVPVAAAAAAPPSVAPVLPPGPVLGGPPPGPPIRRDPRRSASDAGPVARPVPSASARGPPPSSRPGASASSAPDAPPKSANVSHLMHLLKRKQPTPVAPTRSPPRNEVTNDPARAPDPAAVMSILQKLKGMTQHDAPPPAPVVAPAPVQQQRLPMMMPPPPPPPQFLHGRPPQYRGPPPPPRGPLQPPMYHESGASRMWFSDTVVAHKERVESNVQKLYSALPLVCRESGLRFREQERLNAHLDFLFQYNRSLKERGKGGTSRSWYPDEDQWVADFAGAKAPRESTSSSFFDRKDTGEDDDAAKEAAWDRARVPVDEAVTKCRICGESFAKSWDEDEEDWMYTNAVVGTIHNPAVPDGSADQDTIFHKYCYDTVTANSKHITTEHLIPGSPQSSSKPTGQLAGAGADSDVGEAAAAVKRSLESDEDSDDSDEDVKRIRTE
ncbi:hypothetical protein PybrP1_005855 [[Pythium] brassicae (nom. inval.)]|nr:hypothetical protein PybrP1_005855 [[Pythium] brassicae (nom. inval.)]